MFDNLRALCVGAGALVLTVGVGLGGTRAQDELKKPGKRIEAWAAAAAQTQIAFAADPDRFLDFRKEPALRWSNPLRKTDDGTLFLWTDRGRPEVAACLYRYNSGVNMVRVHEFQSLAVAPLVGRHEGRVVWTPTAGVAPAPIADAPPPAAAASGRLRQMRALAREFDAFLNGRADRSELRPLTQPLYRFEVEDARPDVRDGALFGFVHTTDPEVLLLVEARPSTPGGPLAWHFACARMSAFELRVNHKGREVWRADPVADYADNKKPYWALGAYDEDP